MKFNPMKTNKKLKLGNTSISDEMVFSSEYANNDNALELSKNYVKTIYGLLCRKQTAYRKRQYRIASKSLAEVVIRRNLASTAIQEELTQ